MVKTAPQQKWLDVQRRLQRDIERYEENVKDRTEL